MQISISILSMHSKGEKPMMLCLTGDKLPQYYFMDRKIFSIDEKHVNRIADHSTLIIMLSGVLKFSEDGVPMELFPGEYYIQLPGKLQEGIVKSDSPVYHYVHFQGSYNDQPGGLPLRGTFNIVKMHTLLAGFAAISDGNQQSQLERAILFYRMLEELSKSNFGKEKSVDACSDLFYYIKAHSNEDLSLDLLAERYGYTKDYLIRLFKKRYGDTPMNFLVSSRMENAASLILHTDASVTEIAYAVGYTDYSVFYKNFLKYYKLSPSEYKKQKKV